QLPALETMEHVPEALPLPPLLLPPELEVRALRVTVTVGPGVSTFLVLVTVGAGFASGVAVTVAVAVAVAVTLAGGVGVAASVWAAVTSSCAGWMPPSGAMANRASPAARSLLCLRSGRMSVADGGCG